LVTHLENWGIYIRGLVTSEDTNKPFFIECISYIFVTKILMILLHKNAVVYGAGGSLGSAVAKAFAAAGARVFLTGRTRSSLQRLADEIRAAGGNAEVDEVDALDERAIGDHMQKVLEMAGSIDISFNAVGIDVIQNVPLVSLAQADFTRPITLTMQTRFLTATAAGRVMTKQGSGVILSLTATPGGIGYPFTGAFAPACAAVESFSRNLAAELGTFGVRVINIRSGGSPDSAVFKEAITRDPRGMEPVLRKMEDDTMLKELPLMMDIANAAVFLVSGLAGKITGVTIDITSGTTAGLNYRVPRVGE
jgi:3-oxoacyl-[acyl-carrier protein] reductase